MHIEYIKGSFRNDVNLDGQKDLIMQSFESQIGIDFNS
jgi:hypothetical protein